MLEHTKRKGTLLFVVLGALLVALIVVYLVAYKNEWLLFCALGCASLLTLTAFVSSLQSLQTADENYPDKPSMQTKDTSIHRHKAEYVAIVTDLVTKYTTSGKSTGEETVEQEVSALIAAAQGLNLNEALELDQRLAQNDAEPTVDSLKAFMRDDMTEQELLRMGGEALWASSVAFDRG